MAGINNSVYLYKGICQLRPQCSPSLVIICYNSTSILGKLVSLQVSLIRQRFDRRKSRNARTNSGFRDFLVILNTLPMGTPIQP